MPSSRQHSYQLFGVGALAHRGLLPFIGGLCGDLSPHRTTMTQTKCCPILHFGLWWLHLPVVSHGTEDSVPLAALKGATECAECDGGLKAELCHFQSDHISKSRTRLVQPGGQPRNSSARLVPSRGPLQISHARLVPTSGSIALLFC